MERNANPVRFILRGEAHEPMPAEWEVNASAELDGEGDCSRLYNRLSIVVYRD